MAAVRLLALRPLSQHPESLLPYAYARHRHRKISRPCNRHFSIPPSPARSLSFIPLYALLSLPKLCHVSFPNPGVNSRAISCAAAPVSSSSRRWFTRARDPGDWSTSAEWWGLQGGGWGHDAGDIVFDDTSAVGNGEVSVTAHASSVKDGDAELLPAWQQQDTWRILGHQWRVLRFNTVTRQSVARVTALQLPLSPEAGGGEVVLYQQPDCLAFEYLKTVVSAGLSAASLAGLNLKPRQPEDSAWAHQEVFTSSQIRVLCIGLGGGSLPLFLVHHLPGAQVDAVEIDTAVISAAVNAMGFPSWSVQSQTSTAPKQETHGRIVQTGMEDEAPSNSTKHERTRMGKSESERQVWANIWNRLAVYEDDGGRFVEDRVEREGWGWQLDGPHMSSTVCSEEGISGVGYNLVFIDAYDGKDNVPRQLWDRNGNFLRCLSKIVHPTHGTVVVNLHGNLPPPSLFERVTGNCHRGFDPSSAQGSVVQEICRAYRDSLLGCNNNAVRSGEEGDERDTNGRDSGMAFTVATPYQANVALVVSRGGGRPEVQSAGGSKGVGVEALKMEGKTVQELLGIPFDASFRAALGFHVVD